MRKHRLFGVVIACLIGLGVFTQRSDTAHASPGTQRAGIQLASPGTQRAGIQLATPGTQRAGIQLTAVELSTDRAGARPQRTVAADTSDSTATTPSGPAAAPAILSTFGPQALAWDFHVAQFYERAEVSAYLTAVAQRQAALKAYLEAVTPRPAPAPPAPAVVVTPAAPTGDPWAALRQCESGGNYGDDTGNGYYGAYQFNLGTWRSLGFGGVPSQAPPAEQDQAAQELQARRGWSQWPSCARRLGLI